MERRWSNFSLPVLDETDNGELSGGGQVGNLVDAEEDDGEKHDKNDGSLLGQFVFGTPRPYMRPKSEVEMDPDRVRIRLGIFCLTCVRLGGKFVRGAPGSVFVCKNHRMHGIYG